MYMPGEWPPREKGTNVEGDWSNKTCCFQQKTLSSLHRKGYNLFLDWPKGNKQVSQCPDVSFTSFKLFRKVAIFFFFFFEGWGCLHFRSVLQAVRPPAQVLTW